MNHLETALAVALKAHEGQVDKAGQAYITHVLRLMVQANTVDEKIVALLHDVVEDSDLGLADLQQAGFSDVIIEAVDCLTKRAGVEYMHYLEKIKTNPLARQVKLLDLQDNMSVLRLPTITEKDLQRLEKYHKAYHYLVSD